MARCVHQEFGAFAPWGEVDRMHRAVDANQVDEEGVDVFPLPGAPPGAGEDVAGGFVDDADGDGWIVWHLR